MGHVKTCACCGLSKPVSNFYVDRRYNRPIAQCKECIIERVKRYNHEHLKYLNMCQRYRRLSRRSQQAP